MRTGKRFVLALSSFVLLGGVGLAAAREPSPAPLPADGMDLGGDFRAFSSLKQAEIARVAAAEGIEVTPSVRAFFAAVQDRQWKQAEEIYEAARFGNRRLQSVPADALAAGVQDVSGIFELLAKWDPALMLVYNRESQRGIPPGSIIFGGTEEGRFFNIYASLMTRTGDVHVITQNALADTTYSEYMRVALSNRVAMFTTNDATAMYDTFVADVKAGRRDRSYLTFVNAKEQFTGVKAVMELNGMLARLVFDRNSSNRACFVEESYVIPWMYDYLTPHGLVLKLHPAPLAALPPDTLRDDGKYWGDLETQLLAMPAFRKSAAARHAFAKCRCAIAGVYVARKLDAEAEAAFRQALRLDPTSAEAAYRLADLLKAQRAFRKARQVLTDYLAQVEPEESSAPARAYLQDLLRLQEQSGD